VKLISIFSSPSSAEDGLFVWPPAGRIETGGKDKFLTPVKMPVMPPFKKQNLAPAFNVNYFPTG
jgi:hypothetical protein